MATAVLLLAWLLAGLRELDPGQEFGVVDGPLLPGGAVRVTGSLALAPPGPYRLTRYPRQAIELELPSAAEALLAAPDGGRYGFRGRITVRAQPERWRELHAGAAGGGLRGALLGAVRTAGSDLPAGAEAGRVTVALSQALHDRLERELAARGVELRRFKLDAVDRLMAEAGEAPAPEDARVLLVGLDGADWEILDPLLEQGRLPNLKRLIDDGVRAKLRSITPTLSPVVWTSVATGVEPARHGILDFLVEDPDGGQSQPVTSAQRRAVTVWELLSRAGVTVGVVGWWATWPAEPVRGYLVSDRIAYQLFGYRSDPADSRGKTWPPEVYEQVVAPRIVAPDAVEWDRVRPYLGGERTTLEAFEDPEERKLLEEFRTLLAAGESYLSIALALSERERPRFEAVYFEGTDTIGHLFMSYRPPRLPGVDARRFADFGPMVDRYYETADDYLGRLLAGRGEEWTVIVISDHGFVSDEKRPRLTDSRIGHGAAADWHRRFGMLVLSGARVRAGARIEEATVYDIAPTVLALFGQPVPRSWPGRVLGRALEPEFLERHPVRYRADDPPRGEMLADAEGRPVDPEAAALVEKLRNLGYVGSDPGRSTSVTARNNAGIALMTDGRYAEAEATFRAGLADNPDQPSLMMNLGVTLRLMGRDAEARPLFERAFRYANTRREAGHLLAELHIEAGEPAQAKRYLLEVLQGEPGAAEVRTSLGAVLEAEGRIEEAEAEYRRAAELDPNAAKARNHLGGLARRRGDAAAAERWYESAIEADPYFMGAYNNLALVYQDRGEMDRAIDLYSRALVKSPNNAVVLNNLASLYYGRNELDQAAALWRRAVRADPTYPSPLNNLAGLEIRRENWGAAARLLERALELEPGYGDARMNLALVHRARGDGEAALRELRLAAEDPRARGRALAQVGYLAFQAGRYPEAAEALDGARAAGTRDPAVLNLLGESYRLLQREGEAAEAWRASLELDPGQQELRQRLAELERR